MRGFLFAILFPFALTAAQPLEIVKISLSQMEDGVPDPAGFEYFQGQTLYLSCRVAGFAKGSERNIHVTYSVQAFDPGGTPLEPPVTAEIKDELLPQDKDWMPKVATGISIPPLVWPGEFKIVIKVEDLLAKTSTQSVLPFRVRGRAVEKSDTLAVRNMRFLRAESDSQGMTDPVYRVGDELWCAFDITGFKYGPKNHITVNYAISVLGSDGTVLWKQDPPTEADTESFYPKPYVPATISLTTKSVRPGTYTMLVRAADAVGNQTAEARKEFRVQAGDAKP